MIILKASKSIMRNSKNVFFAFGSSGANGKSYSNYQNYPEDFN